MYLSCPEDVIEYKDGRLCMPWYTCYSSLWEIKQNGIKPGHPDGISGQFPSAIEIEVDLNCVMEQIWAGELGFVDHPEPGFLENTVYEPIVSSLTNGTMT